MPPKAQSTIDGRAQVSPLEGYYVQATLPDFLRTIVYADALPRRGSGLGGFSSRRGRDLKGAPHDR